MDEGVFSEAVRGLDSADPAGVRAALELLETVLKKRFDELIVGNAVETSLDEAALQELEFVLAGLRQPEFAEAVNILRGLSQDLRSLMRDAKAMHSSPDMPVPSTAGPEKPCPEPPARQPETLNDVLRELGDELRDLGVLDKTSAAPSSPGGYSRQSGEITQPLPKPVVPSLRLVEAGEKKQETPLTCALKGAAQKAVEEFCQEKPAAAPEAPEPVDGRRYSLHEPAAGISRVPSIPIPHSTPKPQSEQPDIEIVELREGDDTTLTVEERTALAKEAAADVEHAFRKILSKRSQQKPKPVRLRTLR